jgi:hypothetical protein
MTYLNTGTSYIKVGINGERIGTAVEKAANEIARI